MATEGAPPQSEESRFTQFLAQLSVNHVAPKIPTFSGKNPALWITRLENQFAMCVPKVTDQEKRFVYATNQMTEDTLGSVEDLLLTLPRPPDVYDLFTKRVMETFGPSDTHLASSFLDFPPMGDGSATIMAANMLRLLPVTERGSNIVFREIFLRKIPPAIREVLGELREEDKDLLALAKRVDALIAARPATMPTTNSIGTIGKDAKAKQKTRSPTKKNPQGKWCWYHRKHGEAATNCRPPCVFPTTIAGIQEN